MQKIEGRNSEMSDRIDYYRNCVTDGITEALSDSGQKNTVSSMIKTNEAHDIDRLLGQKIRELRVKEGDHAKKSLCGRQRSHAGICSVSSKTEARRRQ